MECEPCVVLWKEDLDMDPSFLYGEFLEEWKKEVLNEKKIIMQVLCEGCGTCCVSIFFFSFSFALLPL
jgi:hypothetical protein